MGDDRQLPFWGRILVFAVVPAGGAFVCLSLYQVLTNPPPNLWLVLAFLTFLSGALTIRVPKITARVSVSETFLFTVILLYGTPAGTLVVAIDGLIMSYFSSVKRPYRVLFNVAEPSLSIWLASAFVFRVTHTAPLSTMATVPHAIALLGPTLLLAAVYFALNSGLTALAIGLEQRKSPIRLWQRFVWLSLNYFGGALVATLLARNSGPGDGYSGFLLIVPLLLVTYLSHKGVEDARENFEKLNSLYLSTIETLAMAIDAKDQITHGHIRRVQLYAVRLAKYLGVNEKMQLKALEAAALLHDTGKLAVPEYILNKPGKLTPAEFEKMKLHASVGADILSSIDFPYPVVPIVRHHHESWDGSGYPGGLKGTDIPIGARILSVVDCFDALTSDRPYRPKLPDDEAIRILLDRRGTMYDPLVVDTFLRVYSDIESPFIEEHQGAPGLHNTARTTGPEPRQWIPTGATDVAASSEELLTLYDLAQVLGGASMADAGDLVAKHLRRLLPASVCIFYLYDQAADELVAAHTSPDVLRLNGFRLAVGQRIAGWVAANRQSIVNSDPVLEFGDIVRSRKLDLRSCLTVPLVSGGGLVGVLSVCSHQANAFNEDHRRILEALSDQISTIVLQSTGFDREILACRDEATGLPNVRRLRRLRSSELGLAAGSRSANSPSLLFIHIAVPLEHSRLRQDVVSHVVAVMRRGLRGGDILFRYQSNEFGALLFQTDGLISEAVADRLRQLVSAHPYELEDGVVVPVIATIVVANHSTGGDTLADFVTLARQGVSAALPS